MKKNTEKKAEGYAEELDFSQGFGGIPEDLDLTQNIGCASDRKKKKPTEKDNRLGENNKG